MIPGKSTIIAVGVAAAVIGVQQWRIDRATSAREAAEVRATLAQEANAGLALAIEDLEEEIRARDAATVRREREIQAARAAQAERERHLQERAHHDEDLRRQLMLRLHPDLSDWLWFDGRAPDRALPGQADPAAAGLPGAEPEAGKAGEPGSDAGRSRGLGEAHGGGAG